MNRILLTPVHRMTARPTPCGGVRWSSYVGDVRCLDNLSKSYFSSSSSSSSSSAIIIANCNDDHAVAATASTTTFHNNLIDNNKNENNNLDLDIDNDDGRRLFSSAADPSGPADGPPRPSSSAARSSRSRSRPHHGRDRDRRHERLLVLGSGVAGCAAALSAARLGLRVTVLHAGSAKEDCNSYWAQGGVIYRNYRLKEEGKGREPRLVDTPLSLVNDIRVASGYRQPLRRTSPLEECAYASRHVLDGGPGRTCPASGVTWNEDAAWKLACEGPARVRQLLLGAKDGGRGETVDGCVVPFDRTTLPTSGEDDDCNGLSDGSEDDVLSLCLEASHAAPRIIHHADCTGKAITVAITEAAASHPLIEFVGDAVATDLIADQGGSDGEGAVIGARVLDRRTNRTTDYHASRGVVLASGGLAGIYQHSTNPSGFNALGSSVGLALRLEESLGFGRGGAAGPSGIVSDLEYVQFHPTSLRLPGEARFLLTEALRGEGAILRDASGRAFARDYHPAGELAPRDVVARAVYAETQKLVDARAGEHGTAHNAFLDITHRDPLWLKERFPSIHAHLSSRSRPMDFTREAIPVIPAAHYTCGGVATDLHGRVLVGSGGRAGGGGAGRWRRGLYAAGEAARTGLHGGNRLASTSLLEGLVFGATAGELAAAHLLPGAADAEDDDARERREEAERAADRARLAIERHLATRESSPRVDGHGDGGGGAVPDERVAREAAEVLDRLKSLMWDRVGVVRTSAGLAAAVSELDALRDEADGLWGEGGGGGAGWEAAALRDATRAGLAVAEAALTNRVSGGAHYIVSDDAGEREDTTAETDGGSGKMSEVDNEDYEDEGLVAFARA